MNSFLLESQVRITALSSFIAKIDYIDAKKCVRAITDRTDPPFTTYPPSCIATLNCFLIAEVDNYACASGHNVSVLSWRNKIQKIKIKSKFKKKLNDS